MYMERQLGLIGVPSSAGAHGPGQEKAPPTLRKAGLIEHLTAAGWSVIDHGDLPRVRCALDREHRHLQNLEPVLDVARNLAERVTAVLEARQIPLVIGGDCTITLGVISGFLCRSDNLALPYMDGGLDLAIPGRYRPGILDSMGVAHMIGEPGTAEELRRVGPRVPLLPGAKIVGFAYTPGEPIAEERALMDRHALCGYPLDQVRGRPREAATEALMTLEGKAGRFIVHFDVDVIDFVDFSAADVPQFNTGLTLQEALVCLTVFAASAKFGGLVITEFNPDHCDEDGGMAATFVQGVAHALRRNKP
jgi:arginase